MVPHSPNGAYSYSDSQILREDGERIFGRGCRLGDEPSAARRGRTLRPGAKRCGNART